MSILAELATKINMFSQFKNKDFGHKIYIHYH